jgi:hypothetical protein
MKKIILFIVIVIVVASCKKSSPGIGIPSNTITATINGIEYTYNKQAYFSTEGDSNYLEMEGYAYINYLHESSYMGISFEVDTPTTVLHPGTYSQSINPLTFASFKYYIENTGQVFYAPTQVSSAVFILTLATNTTTLLQGTFGGTIYLNGDTTKEALLVTNGKFNLNK